MSLGGAAALEERYRLISALTCTPRHRRPCKRNPRPGLASPPTHEPCGLQPTPPNPDRHRQDGACALQPVGEPAGGTLGTLGILSPRHPRHRRPAPPGTGDPLRRFSVPTRSPAFLRPHQPPRPPMNRATCTALHCTVRHRQDGAGARHHGGLQGGQGQPCGCHGACAGGPRGSGFRDLK
jgi:hypothetical protein